MKMTFTPLGYLTPLTTTFPVPVFVSSCTSYMALP
jgi:hypothetical protein